jgi:hypothetical protein
VSNGTGVFCSNTRNSSLECSFSIVERPQDEKGISMCIPVGTSANNSEELKSNCKPENVKIRDKNAGLIRLTQSESDR